MAALNSINNDIQSQLIHSSTDPAEDIETMENFEELEELEQEEEYRNIPPPSYPSPPPSPPGPVAPPAPLWNQEDFICSITRIHNHLSIIEKIVIGPHVLYIDGINNLKRRPTTNWRDRIYQLLFEAKIPFFWVLRFVPDEYDNTMEENKENESDFSNRASNINYPHRIRLYLISHHVKNKVYFILKSFLKNEYNNIVHMD